MLWARTLLAAVLVGTAALTAGCDGGSGLRVGLAYDVGGRGDKSFNDAAAAGIDRVRTELAGQVSQVRELAAREDESERDKYERLALLCRAGFDVVLAVGFEYAGTDPATGPLARAAKDCDDTRFAIVDDERVAAGNVANLVFADEQGAFLAGVAAALKSRTGRVGFVGACRTAVIQRFEAGYSAGATTARPEVTVQVEYLAGAELPCGGFTAPADAERVAGRVYDNGADVIFHAAGGSGLGVFRAARERNRMAIGVDSDQYQIVPAPERDVIIMSMVKRVDTAVFEFVTGVAGSRFTAGPRRFDLATGGVGYAASGGRIDDITEQLEGYKKKIIDGLIVVPTRPG